MRRLILILGAIFSLAVFGFYIGFKLQPQEKEIDSILFSSEHPNLLDPRLLVSYLQNERIGRYTNIEIKEKDHHPIFKTLSAQMHPPSSIYVHYALEKVAFELGDYHNLGLDAEGFPLTLHPFQTPKNVPVVFLGHQKNWKLGQKIDPSLLQILNKLKEVYRGQITWIDLSLIGEMPPKRGILLGLCNGLRGCAGEKTLLVKLNTDHLDEGIRQLSAFLKTVPIVGINQVIKLDLSKKGMGFVQTLEKRDSFPRVPSEIFPLEPLTRSAKK
jgi:hypothetical protein